MGSRGSDLHFEVLFQEKISSRRNWQRWRALLPFIGQWEGTAVSQGTAVMHSHSGLVPGTHRAVSSE